jgi:hypothetical protein
MNKAVLWLIIIILYSCGIQRKELLGKVSPDGKTYIAKDSLFKMTIPEQYSASFKHEHTADDTSKVLYHFRLYAFFFTSLEMYLLYSKVDVNDIENLRDVYLPKDYEKIKDVFRENYTHNGVNVNVVTYLGEGKGPFTVSGGSTEFLKIIMILNSINYTIVYNLHMDVYSPNDPSELTHIRMAKSKFLLELYNNTQISMKRLNIVRDSLKIVY